MENNKDQNKYETDHEYDGIRENDYPLPMWWLATFFGTIVFAFFYYAYYEMVGAPGVQEELAKDLKKIEAMQGPSTEMAESEADLESKMKGSDVLALGAKVYQEKCLACHGPELGGLVGPNLTDKYWIHGKGTRADIIHVVRKGVLDKGMLAWENVLKPEEIYAVTAFVYSKKGSQPANPKAPQGELTE